MSINAIVLALELESLQVDLSSIPRKEVLVQRLTMQFELLVDTMVMMLKATMNKDCLEELETTCSGGTTSTST